MLVSRRDVIKMFSGATVGFVVGRHPTKVEAVPIANGCSARHYQGTNLSGWEVVLGDAGNGYHRYTVTLEDYLGQDEVWLVFVLSSNQSVTYHGITVDDITLETTTADSTPTPTNTYTPSPTRIHTVTPSTTPVILTPSPTHTRAPLTTPSITPSPTPTATDEPPTPEPENELYIPVIAGSPADTGSTLTPTATATAVPTHRPTITPTRFSSPTSTPTDTPPPTPTRTPLPPTNTPLPRPLPGHWEGTTSRDHPMSFEVVANGTQWDVFTLETDFLIGSCSGTITSISFETPLGSLGNVCVVTLDKIDVEEGRTFTATFGVPLQEENNTIHGEFKTDTSIVGSYSELIFCKDTDSGKVSMLTINDTGWNAGWVGP